MSQKTVFICYRRDQNGQAFARNLQLALTPLGYDVFLDVDQQEAGRWEERIFTQVSNRAHFLLLLTPGALDLCADESDWVRREFLHAHEHHRNIVPVQQEPMDINEIRKSADQSMQPVFDFQIAAIRHQSFKHDINTLVSNFIHPHQAPAGTTHPASNFRTKIGPTGEKDRIPPLPLSKKPPPATLEVGLRASLQGSTLKGAVIIDPHSVEEWDDLEIRPIGKSIDILRGGTDKIKGELISVWKDKLQETGWILLTPADLFTDKFSLLSKPTNFHQAEWANDYLLPFTPLVLALYEPDALRKAFRMFRDKDSAIVVEFDVNTLAGNKLTLTKHYREKVQVVPPARLTQWPGYVSSIWRHYYLDARGGKNQAPVARVIATDRLADMLKGLSASDAVTRVIAWGKDDSAPLQVSTQKNGHWRTCHLADRPVEAVTLEGADGLCLTQPIGIMPIKPVDDEFKIAVDFGSSGTRILAMGGGRVVHFGPLEAKLSFIFSSETSISLLDDFVSQEGASLLMSALAIRSDMPPDMACNAPSTM